MKLRRLEINIMTHEDYKDREAVRKFWGQKKEWFVECVGLYCFYFYRLEILWWKKGVQNS